MKLLFFLIVLTFGGLIFYKRGELRLELFLLAVIFIPPIVPYPTSGVNAQRFFILAFWASIVYHNEIGRAKRNVIVPFLLLILISYYLTGFFDNRVTAFSKFWKPTIHFLTEYGLIILGSATLLTANGWSRFRKFVVNVSLVACGYGILTFLINADPYSQSIADIFGDEAGCDFTPLGVLRVRICSFLYNSHKFGYFCAVITIMLTYFHFKVRLSFKERFCLLLVVLSLMISGSRSSLIAAMIGVAIILLLGLRLKRRAQYTLIILLALLPASQLPVVQHSIESLSVIFSDDDRKQTGSSIEMRQNQLEISTVFFAKEPVWGNGFDYYAEIVKPDDAIIKKEGLYGAESYAFILLIERGAVQISAIIVFCVVIIIVFYRNRNVYRLESAAGMALFLSFVSVSITTGNSGKWVFVLPLVGVFLNLPKKQKRLVKS